MAVKPEERRPKKARAKKKSQLAPAAPTPPKGGAAGAAQADSFNGWALAGTLAGWVLLLLGRRVIVEPEGLAKMLTGLGVVCLIAALGQRLWSVSSTTPDRKGSATAFAALSGVGIVALIGYYATTEAGREMLGVKKPALTGEDPFGDVLTVAWVTLLMISVVPSVLGEIARRTMARAERIESRRILAAVAAGLALACTASYTALFTYAADKMDKSVDFSYFRVGRPSESTGRMIDELSDPLTVLVFFPHTTETRTNILRYLNDLRKGREDKLKVEVHDFFASPKLAKEHKVTRDGVLVLLRGKMSQKLEIDVDPERAKRKLRTLDGELQKVLIKVMRDKRTLYLTVGHGELNESTDKREGRTAEIAKQIFESQNYTVKKLGLAEGLAKEVPKDAHMVMVLGPSQVFSEPEIESLKTYYEHGGKLLLALDPDSGVDHAALAAVAGVVWQPNILVNDHIQFPLTRSISDKKVLVVRRFSSHASVSTMSKYAAQGKAVVLPGAAPLDKDKSLDKDYRVDFSLKAESGCYVDVNKNFTFDKDVDKKGSFNVAVSVSRKLGEGKDAEEMRAIVYGDADAFSDRLLAFAGTNQILLAEALRWLGGEESFSGTQSTEEDQAIVHTKADDQVWFYGTIVGFPAMVLGLGLLYTRRRETSETRSAKGKRPPKKKPDEPATKEAEADAAADTPSDSDAPPDSGSGSDDEDDEDEDDDQKGGSA